jgi:hypothetical protein
LVLGQADEVAVGPQFAGTAAAHYFNRRSISILGGSNEIQEHIVAKAVPGLRAVVPVCVAKHRSICIDRAITGR